MNSEHLAQHSGLSEYPVQGKKDTCVHLDLYVLPKTAEMSSCWRVEIINGIRKHISTSDKQFT